ncbi:unnamed protein product [Acanthosepion pharaonis]|uniref:Methyltransferase-like protein 17, mitochondrial n=1 Tax=Acanthosepion pharaonis TaxID=158019 RepID=A0A812CTZ3_ACAPH|nr:unnamed protein product [Sepia pharaonis]
MVLGRKGILFKSLSYNRFVYLKSLYWKLKHTSGFITPESRLVPDVAEMVRNSKEKIPPHVGMLKLKPISVPAQLEKAVNRLIEKYPTNNLVESAASFARVLWGRHPPIEAHELNKKWKEVTKEVLDNTKFSSKLSEDALEKKIHHKIVHLVKTKTYNWQPITYDAYKSFLYMVSRMPANYAVLIQCLSEIIKRDPNFKPRNVFDFGSGTGSSIWACNKIWNKAIFEYFSCDISTDMNTVNRLLLQDGEEQKDMSINGVYLRQFIPVKSTKLYNLVICAYSLFELKSKTDRLNIIYKLWNLTEDYLIIIENGTNAGFHLIIEARNAILNKSDADSTTETNVFSPCPHNLSCPMLVEAKKIPCNFEVIYKPFHFVSKEKNFVERYSYVILQKKPLKETNHWPRVLQSPRKHSKHIHMKLCCPNGEIQHAFITAKKHGKEMYHCLSQSKWGDLLPVTHAPCAQSPNNLQILDNSKATANDVPFLETDPHTPMFIYYTFTYFQNNLSIALDIFLTCSNCDESLDNDQVIPIALVTLYQMTS